MLINNKHVQGIFLYTEENSQVEFEKNDFVVSGDCIYICTAENPTNEQRGTVSGIDPATDLLGENFKPYPGSRVTTAEEYFKILESGEDMEDKYVSSQAIIGILQQYNFGLGMTGMVKDYVDRDGNTTLVLGYNSSTPLNNLMLTKDLNNGTVYVDPKLDEIQNGITYNNMGFSSLFGYDGDPTLNYYLILRQYTYRAAGNGMARVQELVNPYAGMVLFRYMLWPDGEFPGDISGISQWRSSYSYSYALRDKMDTLDTFYKDSQNQWASKFASLSGSFRFVPVAINNSGTSVTVGVGVYTLTLERQETGGILRTDSITIRISQTATTGATYKVPDFCTLKITESGTTGKVNITIQENNGTKIIDAYGRRNYGE